MTNTTERPSILQTFEMTTDDFNKIRDLIYKHAGIVIGEAKKEMVYGRLVRRLRELGLTRFDQYLDILSKDLGSETEKFINSLTTNLTSFFREAHHFPILTKHVSENRGNRTINIWCAAASTGEEPYSIAMTMADLFSPNPAPVKITATDLDTSVLEVAKAGIYNTPEVMKIPGNKAKIYFTAGKDLPANKMQVREDIRKMIAFSQLNLLSPRWNVQGPFDAIFCRNVLIYFDRPTQRRILERFIPLLRPNGLLFVGHSESLFHSSDIFKSVGHTAYEPIIEPSLKK